MNNKYAIGDLVICRVGGSTVSAAPNIPPQNNNVAVAGAGGFVVGGFNGAFVQQPFYTCVWWNNAALAWNQWSFHEDMLEDAPTQ